MLGKNSHALPTGVDVGLHRMKKTGAGWVNWSARAYYVIGLLYYVHGWLIVFGFGGLLVGAPFLALSGSPILANVLAGGVTTASIAAILAGVSFWRRSVRIRLASVNPALAVHEMQITYTYETETDCEYVRSVKIKALSPTSHYRAKFRWSSHGNLSEEIIEGASRIEVSDQSTSLSNLCTITFARALTKPETLKLAYRMRLTQATQPVKRFLGHTTDAPIKHLTLKVRLGQRIQAKAFVKHIFLSPVIQTIYHDHRHHLAN